MVVLVGGLAYLAYVGKQLDREAKAYVDEAVSAIVSDSSADELIRRASYKLLHAAKPDDPYFDDAQFPHVLHWNCLRDTTPA